VNAGYGGGFSNLPTLLSDIYGMGKISSLHGIALSAWAFAGLTGNQIAELIIESSNGVVGYQNVLIFTFALYLIATVIDLLLVKHKKEA
ncbi:MAG: MFS transporter, partial [Clostridia bacterium]|nr:MFS transporter [Clostridia bacterium]